jgi:hypothetical protein
MYPYWYRQRNLEERDCLPAGGKMEAAAGDDGAFFSDVLSLLLLDVDAHDKADDAPRRELYASSASVAQDASPSVKSGAIEHRSAPATPEPATLELCVSPAEDAVRRDREEPHPPTKKRKKNAYRERMKSEMAALRQREFALEGQLRDLQRRRQQALLCPAHRAGEERFQAWKRIAMQHREALAFARQRNLALQTAVGRQIVVIEQLQSLLLVNAADAVALGAATTQLTLQTDQQARRRTPINSSDEELLLAYVEQLDAAIRSTDQVLRESALQLDSPAPAMLAIRPKRGLDGSEFFESTETTVLSLEFDRVRHDAWQIFASLYPNRLDRAAVPESTIVGKVDVAGGNYNLTIHFAARKFEPHHGRLVLVWKALTIGDGEFAGMNSDETGWTDLRPQGSQATVSHSCVQIVPIFSVPPASMKAKRFMEHLMRCGDDDVMTIAQMMESVLLHDPTSSATSEHMNTTTPAA